MSFSGSVSELQHGISPANLSPPQVPGILVYMTCFRAQLELTSFCRVCHVEYVQKLRPEFFTFLSDASTVLMHNLTPELLTSRETRTVTVVEHSVSGESAGSVVVDSARESLEAQGCLQADLYNASGICTISLNHSYKRSPDLASCIHPGREAALIHRLHQQVRYSGQEMVFLPLEVIHSSGQAGIAADV